MSYTGFKGFLCSVIVDLATHHIASNWFENVSQITESHLHDQKIKFSPLVIQNSFLDFTYGFNILPLSFM